MRVIEHSTGNVSNDKSQYAGRCLQFAYNTFLGRFILKLFLLHQPVWALAGLWQSSFITRGKTSRFVKKYDIDKTLFENNNWHSFNDFFTRKYKPSTIKISNSKEKVLAIAEANLTYYKIDSQTIFKIKGRNYRLSDIVNSDDLADEFCGGIAVLYRLSMHNYHRFLYPDNGRLVKHYKLPGVLHTVSSISKGYPIYSINQRDVSVLDLKSVGRILMIEIGAMMVGKIINNNAETFSRGQEKGYFEIGGSSILVVYKKGDIELDSTIKNATNQDMEVSVKIGEVIGKYV